MSSNIPHKKTLSGIPKPSSSSSGVASKIQQPVNPTSKKAEAQPQPSTTVNPTMKKAEVQPQPSTTVSQQPVNPTMKKAEAQPQPSTTVNPTMRKAEAQPQPSSTVNQKPAMPTSTAPPNWAELEAKYKQDIDALTESTEMATIEKEIAEEKLDNYELELQELKDKLAEATLKIDMLQREQEASQTVEAGTTESAVTVYQLQKVEEQNELLKQALIKLRDISTKDKQTLEDLQIEHEELQEKLLELEEKEQKYMEQIKIYEEQIDVSQSAQEMVEKLTQQKTELEDKFKQLSEELDDMEKINDVNEQMLETAREDKTQMTEELDMIRFQLTDAINKRRDMEDYLSDQERTLAKLKDENRRLNDQIICLRDQFKEGESIEQQKHQIENVAYKLTFSESKMAEKEAEITRYKRNLAEMEEQMNNLSLITKEQSTRLEELKLQFDTKVSENADLQRALKRKRDEVSELEIRKDMAEKKLQSLQRETESKMTHLNRTIETMKGMEVQHAEDIKRLMEDNEIIEKERRELRDQLNRSNRSLERSMQATSNSISMMTAQDVSLASLGISFQPIPASHGSSSNLLNQSMLHNNSISTQQMPSTHITSQVSTVGSNLCGLSADLDDSVLMTKIKSLNAAFDHVKKKNYEMEVELAIHELDNQIPPYNPSKLSSYYDVDRGKTLRSEVQKLKREVRAAIINQQICTKSRNVVSHSRNEQFNKSRLALKYQMLENETNALMSSSSLARMRPKEPLLQSTPVR